MNPLVSIVVPVYKVEQFLVRCVKSLVAQSYENIEILLIDDGSPDLCGQICDELMQTDSRIRVFHKANGGLSDARNYGTERAIGDFVTYVDSDDFVAPNYVERMMCAQREHDADIVCCDFVLTSGDTAIYSCAEKDDIIFTRQSACHALMGAYYMPLVIACAKIYRREIVANNPFPVDRIHEDEATTCKFLYAARKVVLCEDKLYGYYQNPNSITRDNKTSNYQAKLWSLTERAQFFHNVSEKELANVAWSVCVSFLISEALIRKEKLSKIVYPFIQEHKLQKRLTLKLYIKLIIAGVCPAILRKKIC